MSTFTKIAVFSFIILVMSVFSSPTVYAKALELEAIKVVPIKDKATDRDYELYIKLPEDYDKEADKKHPVIYIVDALWNIEVISGSIEYFVKDAILVGISWEKGLSPQQSRMRDYMANQYTGDDWEHPTGFAHQHLAFISQRCIYAGGIKLQYRSGAAHLLWLFGRSNFW